MDLISFPTPLWHTRQQLIAPLFLGSWMFCVANHLSSPLAISYRYWHPWQHPDDNVSRQGMIDESVNRGPVLRKNLGSS